jgi:N6-L-threonylcarbamoyladenine synthase
MLVLGVETTCDETSCAVVRDGRQILSNVVSSQIDLHAEYGGVVPELSCRRHVDVFIPILQKALEEANSSLSEIDLFAVAHGPGLIGPLLIGITAVKTLSLIEKKPFIGINHVEAHLYAAIMSHLEPISYPCLGVVLSGGHTALILINEIGSYQLIGETVDDAIGEAFDKIAKLLGLPYPGGPQIESLAQKGSLNRFSFKPGKVKNHPLHFSFSGLKTALLYAVKGQNGVLQTEKSLSQQDKENLSSAFQYAAFTDVIDKTKAAADSYNCKTVVFGGGVTNNKELRRLFAQHAPHLHLLWPSVGLSLDNGAMIAGLAYHHYLKRGKGDSFELEARTRISF